MTRHAELIADLAAEGKSVGRFRVTVEAAIWAFVDDCLDPDNLEMYRHEIRLPNRVPDAYEVRVEDGRLLVRLWEAEVTSLLALNRDKLWEYADFWDASQDWIWLHFEVWTVDRFGERREVDLESAWAELPHREQVPA